MVLESPRPSIAARQGTRPTRPEADESGPKRSAIATVPAAAAAHRDDADQKAMRPGRRGPAHRRGREEDPRKRGADAPRREGTGRSGSAPPRWDRGSPGGRGSAAARQASATRPASASDHGEDRAATRRPSERRSIASDAPAAAAHAHLRFRDRERTGASAPKTATPARTSTARIGHDARENPPMRGQRLPTEARGRVKPIARARWWRVAFPTQYTRHR